MQRALKAELNADGQWTRTSSRYRDLDARMDPVTAPTDEVDAPSPRVDKHGGDLGSYICGRSSGHLRPLGRAFAPARPSICARSAEHLRPLDTAYLPGRRDISTHSTDGVLHPRADR
jgi:hypothetical protein